MQMNLVEVKELLSSWYLLTLENPIYAGTLVISAWLLTVLFYSIRIFFLNKNQRKIEQQAEALQSQLEDAQQQVEQSKATLLTLQEQLTAEQQQAASFAEKMDARHQDVITKIKDMATQFDLSEQLVDAGEKAEPELIWQQQDNIQMQLADRLQAEQQAKETLQRDVQQEKEQLVAKEAQIEQLQSTVNQHVQQLSQLEQELARYKQDLQQQELAVQTALAEAAEKHQQELLAITTELDKRRSDSEAAAPVDREEILHDVVDVAAVDAEEEESAELTETLLDRDAAIVLQQEQQEQGFMSTGRAVEQESQTVEESRVEEQTVPELEEVPVSEQTPEILIVEPMPEPIPDQESVEPEYEKSNLNIAGKFKSLFTKSKKTELDVTAADADAEQNDVASVAESVLEEPETNVSTTPDYEQPSLDISGKFKGLFGQSKKAASVATTAALIEKATNTEALETTQEPEVISSASPDYDKSNIDISGKLKGLFAKTKKTETALDDTTEVLTNAITDSALTGKVKGVFGKTKPEVDAEEALESVENTETLRVTEITPDAESVPVEPDYGASNIKMPKLLQGLFGKK